MVHHERPHPGAQLSFAHQNRHRFQSILTDQTGADVAKIKCRNRAHAHVETRFRDDKHTGLAKSRFEGVAMNEVWLQIAMLAHDLLIWTKALLLEGEPAKAEPKRLHHCLLHVAGRLSFSARWAKLHLPESRPWVTQLRQAFEGLEALLAIGAG